MNAYSWVRQFAGRVFAPGQRPHVTSYGSVIATDVDSAIAQFKTEFGGTLPANCYLAGPLTDTGFTEWVLETYVNETPPPETDTFRKVS